MHISQMLISFTELPMLNTTGYFRWVIPILILWRSMHILVGDLMVLVPDAKVNIVNAHRQSPLQ